MATVYNIGSEANSPAANRAAILSRLNSLPSADAILQLTGEFAAFYIPKNIGTFKVTITSLDVANPALMLGISITGSCNDGLFREPEVLNSAQASSVSNLSLEWLTFRAPRIKQVRLNGSPTGPIYTFKDDPDGTGYGWHIDPTFPGFQGYGANDNANMVAIWMGGGINGVSITDCSFNGWGIVINVPASAKNVYIAFNSFEEWCEDCLFIAGSSNTTIEYNIWQNFRGLSARDAQDGFGRTRPEPPHSDMIQLYGKSTNLVIQYNEFYDDTNRAHPMLIKIADGGPNGGNNVPQSQWHVGLVVRNNFANSTHGTGMWVDYAIAPLIERNWQKKQAAASTTPTINIGRNGSVTPSVTDAVIKNNVGPQVYPKPANAEPGGYAQITGNSTDTSKAPTGWIEMRRGNPGLAPGALYTGPGGGGGTVPEPTPPPGLTAGQVAFGSLVSDPAFPGARKTFTVTVPAGSPGRNANEFRWGSDADTTVRAMTRLADSGGNQVWRASSGSTVHLRNPFESFTNVRLYYRPTASDLLSDPSTYSFSVTVPYVADPDPIPTNVIDFSTLRQAIYGGRIAEIRAKGARWRPGLCLPDDGAPPIAFVGVSGANTTSIALPATDPGNVVFLAALAVTDSTIPGLPTTDPVWEVPVASAAVDPTHSGTFAGRLVQKFPLVSAEGSGTFTSTQAMIGAAYSGVRTSNPILALKWASGNSNTIAIPALSFDSDTAWVGFGWRNGGSESPTLPSGFTSRDGTASRRYMDSNGPMSAFAGANITLSTARPWVAFAFAFEGN